MNVDDTDKTFDVLRELPLELSVEQVGGMVATFTLASSVGSWFSTINLNSILMTSAGAIIIAGSIYLLGPNDQEPRTARTLVPSPVPTEELAATPAVEDQLEAMPAPTGPVVEATPGIQEEAVAEPEPQHPPIAFVAPVPPIRPLPPVRAITVIPAPPGVMVMQNCTLAVDPERMVMGAVSKEFDLTGFTAVSVQGAMDVVLAEGEFSVKAEGDEHLIERLDVTVKDKTLVITTKNKEQEDYDTDEPMVVKVNLPSLERIALTGSGDVRMGQFSATDKFDMDLKGSGEIHFDALKGLALLSIDLDGSGDIVGEKVEVSGKTKISVSGSGDIRLAGHSEVMEVTVMGSGDVDASKVEARNCEVKVTGSGDVNVNCKGGARSHITGSGAINNVGNADGGGKNGEGSHSN